MNDQIRINDEIVTIKPIKLKYLQDGFYFDYLIIKKYGVINILLLQGGVNLVYKFLNAVFNGNTALIKKTLEESGIDTLEEILDKIKTINEIDDEDDLKNFRIKESDL